MPSTTHKFLQAAIQAALLNAGSRNSPGQPGAPQLSFFYVDPRTPHNVKPSQTIKNAGRTAVFYPFSMIRDTTMDKVCHKLIKWMFKAGHGAVFHVPIEGTTAISGHSIVAVDTHQLKIERFALKHIGAFSVLTTQPAYAELRYRHPSLANSLTRSRPASSINKPSSGEPELYASSGSATSTLIYGLRSQILRNERREPLENLDHLSLSQKQRLRSSIIAVLESLVHPALPIWLTVAGTNPISNASLQKGKPSLAHHILDPKLAQSLAHLLQLLSQPVEQLHPDLQRLIIPQIL